MSFPNTIQGSHAEPYNTGSVRLYDLGQRLECPNGRIYRYSEMGATVGVANKIYASEAPDTALDTLQIAATQTAATSTTMTFTNGTTAITEDMFKFGYVIVEETDDLGEIHRIYSNNAVAVGGEGTLYLYPGDVVQVTVDTTGGNVITIIKNPFKDIIIAPLSATLTSHLIGVPPVIIAANAYGWVQTHGVCSILVEGTPIIGQEVRITESTSAANTGAVTALDYNEDDADEDLGTVARCMEVAATTEFGTFFLVIEGAS